MKKILLVDDDTNILHALQRELREFFEIEAFDNPEKALEHCRVAQFDLVIADYKMPGMNGIDFLKQFGQLQPDASRLLLSGEADIDALIRTINETHIYRFLAKPWEKAELLSSILQALSYRDAILENRNHGKGNAIPSTPAAPYRIVVVENDEHLLSMLAHGLSDESGQTNMYGAMQQELTKTSINRPFKCQVNGFRDANSALLHIAKNHCDLIIAAQNLPDMEGIQLLSQLKQRSPTTARILLSNDPDKSILSQAINQAEVNNLLQLYWSSAELRANARRQAWNVYQLKTAAIQALAAQELRVAV